MVIVVFVGFFNIASQTLFYRDRRRFLDYAYCSPISRRYFRDRVNMRTGSPTPGCGGISIMHRPYQEMECKSKRDIEAAYAIAELSTGHLQLKNSACVEEPRRENSDTEFGSPRLAAESGTGFENIPFARFTHVKGAVMPSRHSQVQKALKRKLCEKNQVENAAEEEHSEMNNSAMDDPHSDPLKRAIELERDHFSAVKRSRLQLLDEPIKEGRFVRTCMPSISENFESKYDACPEISDAPVKVEKSEPVSPLAATSGISPTSKIARLLCDDAVQQNSNSKNKTVGNGLAENVKDPRIELVGFSRPRAFTSPERPCHWPIRNQKAVTSSVWSRREPAVCGSLASKHQMEPVSEVPFGVRRTIHQSTPALFGMDTNGKLPNARAGSNLVASHERLTDYYNLGRQRALEFQTAPVNVYQSPHIVVELPKLAAKLPASRLAPCIPDKSQSSYYSAGSKKSAGTIRSKSADLTGCLSELTKIRKGEYGLLRSLRNFYRHLSRPSESSSAVKSERLVRENSSSSDVAMDLSLPHCHKDDSTPMSPDRRSSTAGICQQLLRKSKSCSTSPVPFVQYGPSIEEQLVNRTVVAKQLDERQQCWQTSRQCFASTSHPQKEHVVQAESPLNDPVETVTEECDRKPLSPSSIPDSSLPLKKRRLVDCSPRSSNEDSDSGAASQRTLDSHVKAARTAETEDMAMIGDVLVSRQTGQVIAALAADEDGDL